MCVSLVTVWFPGVAEAPPRLYSLLREIDSYLLMSALEEPVRMLCTVHNNVTQIQSRVMLGS